MFDSPFGFAEAPSDFANTAFLDETLADHPALNLRKLLDKPKEMNVALDEVQISGREIGLGQRMLKLIGLLFAIGALEMVDDRVRGNTEKPGRERSPAPLVVGKIGEGFVEHFRGKVFGDGTVVDAADNEEIDAIEMKLVEDIKFREVGLSRLDQQALVGVCGVGSCAGRRTATIALEIVTGERGKSYGSGAFIVSSGCAFPPCWVF